MLDHHEKQARKTSLLLYTKLLDRTSQQIQWLVDLLFDGKFDAEHGAIER